ncbi:prohibitin family protein [Polynucleobacter sp. JS-Safj-400b-B2]|uniref:prohibitin family protein n=1 Tax=Polynucleobacter sp. JS-Safj-400b-B2 TaxID=2576921 RepID=UPI001C0E6B5E|nr:prohibitin family protein [Polynucleobacter sp. JS-Safj-400b-B2]MBU3625914.1 prohibitin family protein [Polynucleobacter sp. JS-Safj-400b-B2]
MFVIILGILLSILFFGFLRLANSGALKAASPLAIAPILLALAFESFTIVPAGHIGVQQTLGSVNMGTLGEGVHIVNPISDVNNVDVRVVKAELKGSQGGTKDLQVVHTDIVVNYRIDGTKAAHIYKEFGLNLEDKILMPAINESFKAITAHYSSEELITKRDEVSHAIHDELQAKVLPYGLTISSISLVNFGFSPEYQKAIEQKVISTQATLKAEQDLKRIEVEAEQAVAKAQGEAKAIAIQSQAINAGGGKDYVNLKAIEKWDGKLPATMAGTIPFVNVGK